MGQAASCGACPSFTSPRQRSRAIDASVARRHRGFVTRDVSAIEARSDDDEPALVRDARGGDPGAWAELHHRYARMVHGILLARAPVGEVEDLVQDVFVKALQGLPRLRDVAVFGPWLARIARNRATDALRRKGRRKLSPLPDDVLARDVPQVEAREALAALRRVPEAFRETLVMRLVEGMSGPEIAARTGRTAGSIRVNLHRGMKHLREVLGWTE